MQNLKIIKSICMMIEIIQMKIKIKNHRNHKFCVEKNFKNRDGKLLRNVWFDELAISRCLQIFTNFLLTTFG